MIVALPDPKWALCMLGLDGDQLSNMTRILWFPMTVCSSGNEMNPVMCLLALS